MKRQLIIVAVVALWLARPGLPAADDLRDPAAGAAIEPRPGAQVPAAAMFADETGKEVQLGDYLGGPPVILAPVYYTCPNLCGSTLADLAAVLRRVPLTPGSDYRFVAVSIDPRERPADAARAKARALAAAAPPALAANIHLLTGADAPVKSLMQAIGFRYRWDEELQQYTHLAGIGVLTGDGRLARWLPGIGLEPADLRLAIADTGRGGIAGLADSFLLLCSHYDPQTGRYTPVVTGILKIAGVLTVVALA
ncbi:MAG: SCO family protein, partial [Rhodospirillales bacterium]|nr:SCO family protein [Rhodospirillales bacterium]